MKTTLFATSALLLGLAAAPVRAQTSAARMLQYSEANKLPTYPLYISDQKTTHLVFPFPVTYVDLGSSGLIAAKATGAENIVRVKAASAGFPESNMTVLTSDGKLYSFVELPARPQGAQPGYGRGHFAGHHQRIGRSYLIELAHSARQPGCVFQAGPGAGRLIGQRERQPAHR